MRHPSLCLAVDRYALADDRDSTIIIVVKVEGCLDVSAEAEAEAGLSSL